MARRFRGSRRTYVKKNYFGGFRNRGKRFYKRSGLNLSMPFIAGAAIGAFTDVDNNIPTEIKVLGATAPIKGFGMVKGFAQGMLFGDVLYKYIKGGVGGLGGNGGTGGAI